MSWTALLENLLRGSVAGKSQKLETGECLFREGDACRFLYAVESGRVRLERCTPEGRTVVLYIAGSGESFAEAALFSDTYHCQALAMEPSNVLRFSREEVRQAIRREPDIAEEFIELLASQVRSLRSRLELRNILSARDRLLQALQLAASDDGTVTLQSSLKGLAAEIGLAHETLYRELARLEDEGLLRRDGGQIHLV